MRYLLFAIVSALPISAGPGGLPLLFEQQDDSAYRVRGNGYAVRIHRSGLTLATAAGTTELLWRGANPASIAPQNPQATRVHDLRGNCFTVYYLNHGDTMLLILEAEP